MLHCILAIISKIALTLASLQASGNTLSVKDLSVRSARRTESVWSSGFAVFEFFMVCGWCSK